MNIEGLILDIILLAVVLLFALLGARKGLVLSLCSLVAVVIALIGGSLTADVLAPPLAKQAAPMVEQFVNDNLDALLSGQTQGESGFLWGIAKSLTEDTGLTDAAEDFVARFSTAMAAAVLRPILFLLAFILILILWYFISHALDLVAKLPVLSTLNTAGGLLFGAVKGALFLVLASLLIQLFFPDLIPPEALEHSRILASIQKAPALF